MHTMWTQRDRKSGERHAHRRTATGAVLAVAVLLTACTATANLAGSSGGDRNGATSSTAPAPGPAPATAKPALVGLIDMGVQNAYQTGQPFPTTDPSSLDAYAGAFGGIVVNESWSQLEPSSGVEQWAPLDQSLAAVTAWNTAHPSTPLGVKLRIFAGRSAPGWVTAQSGTVTIVVHGHADSVGRWWTPPFESAWHDFQQALAARYDTDPLVRQVSVSSCSSSTGEPFVVSGARASQDNLKAAGWTLQAQEQCLSGALSDYSGWKRTPVTFAFNPLDTPSGPDAAFTQQVMQSCVASAAAGGPHCVLGNNDLSPSAAQGHASPVYAQIDTLAARTPPPAVYFQTVGTQVTCATMAVATSHHASSVELWPPRGSYEGFAAIPVATLTAWDTALAAGRSITC